MNWHRRAFFLILISYTTINLSAFQFGVLPRIREEIEMSSLEDPLIFLPREKYDISLTSNGISEERTSYSYQKGETGEILVFTVFYADGSGTKYDYEYQDSQLIRATKSFSDDGTNFNDPKFVLVIKRQGQQITEEVYDSGKLKEITIAYIDENNIVAELTVSRHSSFSNSFRESIHSRYEYNPKGELVRILSIDGDGEIESVVDVFQKEFNISDSSRYVPISGGNISEEIIHTPDGAFAYTLSLNQLDAEGRVIRNSERHSFSTEFSTEVENLWDNDTFFYY